MNHPYPEHIRQAVAGQFAGLLGYVFNELPDHDQDLFRRNADMILTALWDASRVDTVEQLDALPDEAVINDGYFTQTKDVNQWTGGFHQFANNDQIDLPVHVIYWGDSDE